MSDTVLAHHTITLDGLRQHYVRAGAGELVILLHGWGQTWREWARVMPGFAREFTVVAPDLRGMGDSGKPASGYEKRIIAGDIAALIRHLGFKRAHVVGHDFGLAVAFALAHEYPETVQSLCLMEFMLPGFGGEKAMQLTRNGGRWHLGFHAKSELAEMLIGNSLRPYLTWFYKSFAYDPTAISDADIDDYVRCYSAPGALGASLNYYRTAFDDEDDNLRYGAKRLAMPILALGGASNMGDRVLTMMAPLGERVKGGAVERAGHWIPDERPDWLIEHLPLFFHEAEEAAR
jgi:pimeloyl-ACP methyl ester carboxylesterase